MALYLPFSEKFTEALRAVTRKDVEFAAMRSSPKGEFGIVDVEIGESNADNPCEAIRAFALMVYWATESEEAICRGESDLARELLMVAGQYHSLCEVIILTRARENGVLIPEGHSVGIAYIDKRFRAVHFTDPDEEEEKPAATASPKESPKPTLQ